MKTDRDRSRASRGLLGFMLGLVLASWLAGDVGPTVEGLGRMIP
jgi:hypothetical protein